MFTEAAPTPSNTQEHVSKFTIIMEVRPLQMDSIIPLWGSSKSEVAAQVFINTTGAVGISGKLSSSTGVIFNK